MAMESSLRWQEGGSSVITRGQPSTGHGQGGERLWKKQPTKAAQKKHPLPQPLLRVPRNAHSRRATPLLYLWYLWLRELSSTLPGARSQPSGGTKLLFLLKSFLPSWAPRPTKPQTHALSGTARTDHDGWMHEHGARIITHPSCNFSI
jgi:hypothetical protein